jgi:antibiotic biosynthesis monooxygenase (ABM) superfamily enzyme
MYGTVAYLRVKPGAEAKLQQHVRDFEALKVPGYVFLQIYRLDASSNTCVMVVGFATKADYAANAASPEQNARYLAYREFLEADPEWHDGEIIYSYAASQSAS